MRAVVLDLPDHWRLERENTPGSHRDEMWDGVLHMAPTPNTMHQDFAGRLYAYLLDGWADPTGGRAFGEMNVAPAGQPDWRQNYRVPDVVLVGPDRLGIDHDSHLAGAPTVVVEVESPGDDTRAKLAFYATLRVPAVWIFARDSKAFEILALTAGTYAATPAGPDGWTVSAATGVAFRPGDPNRVWVRAPHAAARQLPAS